MGLRYAPYAFTEEGVSQLSTVLNSERAIKVNIQIIRIFGRMHKMAGNYIDIIYKLEELEAHDIEHDRRIELILEYLKQLENIRIQEVDQKNRPFIGFKQNCFR